MTPVEARLYVTLKNLVRDLTESGSDNCEYPPWAVSLDEAQKLVREIEGAAPVPASVLIRPAGKMHCCGENCEKDCESEDACDCACGRCDPWNEYLEATRSELE